jgi:hypothetical protein
MRYLTCALAALAVGLGCTASAVADGPYDRYLAPASSCPDAGVPGLAGPAQEATMLCLIDFARSTRGLHVLAHAPLLAASAAIKADDIVRCDDFTHTACGKAWDAPLVASGYLLPGAKAEGDEILGAATDQDASPRMIVRTWLGQDEHRATLFGSRWRDEGVAMQQPPLGLGSNTIWVAHFGWRTSPASADTPAGGPQGAGLHPAAPAAGSAAVFKLTTLRLTALPARVRSGHRVRFRFVLSARSAGARRPIGGTTVYFASRRARTDAKGRAAIVMRLRRPGRYRAVVSIGAYRATRTVIAKRK